MLQKETLRKSIKIVLSVCLIPVVFSVAVEFYLRAFDPYYCKKVDTISTDQDAILMEMPELAFSEDDALLFEKILSSRQFSDAEDFGYEDEKLLLNGDEACSILELGASHRDEVEIQIEGEKQGSFSVLVAFYEGNDKRIATKELRRSYHFESTEEAPSYFGDGYRKRLYTDIKPAPESSENRVFDMLGNPIDLPFTYVEYINENGQFEKRQISMEVQKWKYFEFPYL